MAKKREGDGDQDRPCAKCLSEPDLDHRRSIASGLKRLSRADQQALIRSEQSWGSDRWVGSRRGNQSSPRVQQ